MSPLLYALIIAFVDTLLGFSGVVTLKLNKRTFNKVIFALIAFAAGSLLGGAFFHLLPETIERKVEPLLASVILIVGFLTFMLLEEWMHWHKCHHAKESNISAYSYLMLVGDFIHNSIDGIVLVGTALANMSLGIVTSIMILAHELPEELGIFAVLVHGGIEDIKSLYYSVIAQSSIFLGVIIGYFLLRGSQVGVAYLLPFAAGGFIYISASDLIPEINSHKGNERFIATFWLVIGLLFMLGIKLLFE